MKRRLGKMGVLFFSSAREIVFGEVDAEVFEMGVSDLDLAAPAALFLGLAVALCGLGEVGERGGGEPSFLQLDGEVVH